MLKSNVCSEKQIASSNKMLSMLRSPDGSPTSAILALPPSHLPLSVGGENGGERNSRNQGWSSSSGVVCD